MKIGIIGQGYVGSAIKRQDMLAMRATTVNRELRQSARFRIRQQSKQVLGVQRLLRGRLHV